MKTYKITLSVETRSGEKYNTETDFQFEAFSEAVAWAANTAEAWTNKYREYRVVGVVEVH